MIMARLRNQYAERWDPDAGIEDLKKEHPFYRKQTGISFADLDNETERGGHFLNIEYKRTGEELSTGQIYTNRARVYDGRTVLVVWGNPPYDVQYMARFHVNQPLIPIPATFNDFLEFCRQWFLWANNNRKTEKDRKVNSFKENPHQSVARVHDEKAPVSTLEKFANEIVRPPR
jgi:hypothetical protein